MIDKEQTIKRNIEQLANSYKVAETREERTNIDRATKNFLDFFVSEKELYKKYINYYEEKKK